MSRDNLGDPLNHRKASLLVKQFESMIQHNQSQFFEQDSFECIIEYYEERFEFSKALAVSEYALTQHPFSSVFLLKKAQFLFESRDCNSALALLDKASILSPTDLETAVLRAEIYAYLSHYQQAEEILNDAIIYADREERINIYLTLADVYEDWGKENKSFEYITYALKLDLCHERALNKMDYVVEMTGKYEESIGLHKYIVDEEPYCYLAWYNLGSAYYGLGLYEKAIEAYGFVTVINENYDLAYRDCGDAYFEIEQYHKAKEQYLAAAAVSDADDELFYSIGVCAYELDEYQQAVHYFEKAVQINEEHSEAFFYMGECYAEQYQLENALKCYHKAINLDHDNAAYIATLAEFYYDIKNHDMAVMLYYQAIQTDPKQKNYWHNLVRLYFKLKLYSEALDVMETTMIEIGETTENRYLLAACLWVTGQKETATQQLTTAFLDNFEQHELFLELLPHLETDAAFNSLLDTYRPQN